MVTLAVDELPDALRRFAEAATALGWQIWATRVDADETIERPATIAVRLGHGEYRCYGVWTLGLTAKGKPSAKWRGGASRHGHHFPTLTALKSYAGLT